MNQPPSPLNMLFSRHTRRSTSGIGTNATCRRVRYTVAVRGKADIESYQGTPERLANKHTWPW